MSTSPVSTARILAQRALGAYAERECVTWAVEMLTTGHDSRDLRILAGLIEPLNPFEVARLRDRALDQLGVGSIVGARAIRLYAAERLRAALAGQVDLATAIAEVAPLYEAPDRVPELHDLWLLDMAYRQLLGEEVQWYWPGATRENIRVIMREQAQAFVDSRRA